MYKAIVHYRPGFGPEITETFEFETSTKARAFANEERKWESVEKVDWEFDDVNGERVHATILGDWA